MIDAAVDTNDWLASPAFTLGAADKRRMLTQRLVDLSRRHYAHCAEYKKMVDALGCDLSEVRDYQDLPFLPVSLFKNLDLLSVPRSEIVKTMTSSGTTGQAVSRIYLDRTTASNQQKVMVRIVSDFLGASRMPMLVIDAESILKNRNEFSARGAAILGFSIFASTKLFALDDSMALRVDDVAAFLEEHSGKPIFLFGFTFMVWQHFIKELARLRSERGLKLDISKGVLIHGGGWKKLISEAVSPSAFRKALHDACGIERAHDYYGMVEQTGCIYVECSEGHLHASSFSDVVIRRPRDFSPAAIGESGIINVVSALPESYPGHSLLTEDEGTLLGEDDCRCGRLGRYFRVLGRLKNAEIRGCGDTYATRF